MAERAQLLTRRADGCYDVWSSRWGGTDSALASVTAGTAPNTLADVSWHRRATGLAFEAVVASLDYLSMAALYRTDGDETTAFLPLWFGLPLSDFEAAPTVGGLVAVTSLSDARGLRTQFQEFKNHLADGLAAGILTPAAVTHLLCAWVEKVEGRERYLSVTAEG